MGGCSPSTRSNSGPRCFSELSPQVPRYERTTRFSRGASQALRAPPAPVRLDLSVGSDDELGFTETTTAFAKALDNLKPKGLDYRLTVYPGQNHNSVRLVSFPAGLCWVYREGK